MFDFWLKFTPVQKAQQKSYALRPTYVLGILACMVQIPCAGWLHKDEVHPISKIQRCRNQILQFLSCSSSTSCWMCWHACPVRENNLYYVLYLNNQNWPTQPECSKFSLWSSQSLKKMCWIFLTNKYIWVNSLWIYCELEKRWLTSSSKWSFT